MVRGPVAVGDFAEGRARCCQHEDPAYMKRITVTLDESQVELLDELSSDGGHVILARRV